MPNNKLLNTIAYMLGYIVIHDPKTAKEILTNSFVVPSLDGKGKMSKSVGGKTVIWLTDSKKDISSKIAKIPSNKENWHVFVKLAWSTFTDIEKNEVANMAVERVKAVL